MSNGRKIILHIGFPKTGTTTIQNTLYTNREFLLKKEGILYPSLESNLTTPLRTIFREHSPQPFANRMAALTIEEETARREKYRDLLEAEISSREWDVLLLSAEGFCNMPEPEIAKLREWGEKYSFDWTILACVRHPLTYTRSVIPQVMWNGDTLRELYETPPLPNFRGRISKAISVFGRENVRVFDFETATNSDDGIVGTFARQVGLTASSCNFLASQTIRRNESLSLEAVRILDSLNRRRPLFVNNVRAPRRSGRELYYISRIKGQKFDVPDWVKENIRLQSRGDVAWLNETFGLELYRDVADSSSSMESREEPPGTLSDQAIDGIAEIIGELITESAFRRILNQARAASGRGDFEHAAQMLRKAARLYPDSPEPKKLLRKVTAKQLANSGKAESQGKNDKFAKRASFLNRFWR